MQMSATRRILFLCALLLAAPDAVSQMVRFRQPVSPNPSWVEGDRRGLAAFEAKIGGA